jgi:hypothetical protein
MKPYQDLDINQPYEVKQMPIVHLVTGLLLIIIGLFFFICLFYAYNIVSILICLTTIFGGIINLKKAKSKRISILINTQGIYYYNELLTTWENYICSFAKRELAGNGLSENVYVVVEYYKPNETGYFVRKIKMQDDEDKSENDIIEAIIFYYENRNKAI